MSDPAVRRERAWISIEAEHIEQAASRLRKIALWANDGRRKAEVAAVIAILNGVVVELGEHA
jgi:hypothetical protein